MCIDGETRLRCNDHIGNGKNDCEHFIIDNKDLNWHLLCAKWAQLNLNLILQNVKL